MELTYLALSRLGPLVVLVMLISHSWSYWTRKRAQRKNIALHNCEPVWTQERAFWYFGLDIAYDMVVSYQSGSRNQSLVKVFETHGKTFRTEAADRARIFTIDPQNLRAVFGGRPSVWGVEPVRLEAFRPLMSEGVLITDGNAWRTARSMALSVIERIHRSYNADMSQLDGSIESMLALMPMDGLTVDLQPIFNMFTIDLSSKNLFGSSIGAMSPGSAGEYGRSVLDAFLHCLKRIGERDEMPMWSHVLPDRKFARSCKLAQDFVDNHIDRAIELNMTNNTNEGDWTWAKQDKRRARDHMLNIISASFDTSAILLTNVVFHLARHPQSYQKLRDEVLSMTETLDANSVKKLDYLQCVLREVLRLHGPASFDSRVALQDTYLPTGGGASKTARVFVPKGDNVISSFYALHRQKDIWGDDAADFRPERWETIKPSTWDYLPFSGGSRVCPGQKVALLQAAYVMFHLVRRVKAIENRDATWEYVEEYHVATGSVNGALVALVPA